MKAPTDPRMRSAFMTDSELAALLGVSAWTLRDWANNGPPATATAAIDWRQVAHIKVGRCRRWRRVAVYQALGITAEEALNSPIGGAPEGGSPKAGRRRSRREAEREATRAATAPGPSSPCAGQL